MRTPASSGKGAAAVVATLVAGAHGFSSSPYPPGGYPNIAIFLVDDLGFNQVGYHASAANNFEVQTPSIDTHAQRGIIMNRGYTTPWCAPSRAALQTGRLDLLNEKVGNNIWDRDQSQNFTGGLIVGTETFAAVLKREANYHTSFVGKWGIGGSAFLSTPTGMGYDEFAGFFGDSIESCDGREPYLTGSFPTPLISELPGYWQQIPGALVNSTACEIIMASPVLNEQEKMIGCKSFAITPSKLIDLDILERATTVITEHDYEKQPLLHVHAMQLMHVPMEYPESYGPDDLGLNKEDATNDDLRQYTNAALRFVDDAFDTIATAFKNVGQWEKTIMLFTSDNGGATYTSTQNNNHPLRGGKFSNYEGGVRIAQFLSGGWVEAHPSAGSVSNTYTFINDWPITLMEMAGISDPEKLAEPADAMSGKRMWNYIVDGKQNPREVSLAPDFFYEITETETYKLWYTDITPVNFNSLWPAIYPQNGEFTTDMSYMQIKPCGDLCCYWNVDEDESESTPLPVNCTAMKERAEKLWENPERDPRMELTNLSGFTSPSEVGIWTVFGGSGPWLSRNAEAVEAPVRCVCDVTADGVTPAEVTGFRQRYSLPNVCDAYDTPDKPVKNEIFGGTPCSGGFINPPLKATIVEPSFESVGVDLEIIGLERVREVMALDSIKEYGEPPSPDEYLEVVTEIMAQYSKRRNFTYFPNVMKWPFVLFNKDSCPSKKIKWVPTPVTQVTPWVFSFGFSRDPTNPQPLTNLCMIWNSSHSFCPTYQNPNQSLVVEWVYGPDDYGIFENGSEWRPILKDECDLLCPAS